MTEYCIEATVTGRVQGVFFRNSTQEMAQSLGLTGWVKNNTDGSVLLCACGEKTQVEQLIEWLNEGPPLAKVTSVSFYEKKTADIFHEFLVLR